MKKNMKNQKGFSLVELLVVVIIIGIIAAIAIPSLLSSRKSANQASAAGSIRTIHSAQVTRLAGSTAAFGTFAQLTADKLLDASFASSPVVKNTYTFTLTTDGTNYCATATTADATMDDFAVSTDGAIYAGPTAACSATFVASGDRVLGE